MGTSSDTEMQTFYAKVQEVREKMEQMSAGQRQLLRLHEQSKTAVQVDKTRRIREQMADVTDGVLRQAKIVKADVDYLEKANAEALRRVRAACCSHNCTAPFAQPCFGADVTAAEAVASVVAD
jgi:t-SNARE complex subunit (syntaxin)